jgi:hypothetical protein
MWYNGPASLSVGATAGKMDLLSLRPLRIRLRIIEVWIAPEEKRVRMVFTTASLSVLVLAKTPARKATGNLCLI